MNAPTVDQLRPMLAPDATVKPFTDPDWIYELKFDGYRTMAGVGAGVDVDLRTKTGKPCSHWYPEVAEQLATLPGGPHVIDGEASHECSSDTSPIRNVPAGSLAQRVCLRPLRLPGCESRAASLTPRPE